MTQELLNVKAGDIVAVLIPDRSAAGRGVYYKPNRLSTVQKVTAKQIFITNDYRFDLDGHPSSRQAKGSKITTDPTIIAELQVKAEKMVQERAEREKAEEERDNRKTYQLACQIARQVDSSKAIADLELLGEEYLQRIVDDIAKAKEAT